MPPGHVHEAMQMAGNPLGIGDSRDGSGTSWMPDASPMQSLMHHRGAWMLMLHGNAFVQFMNAGSLRGDTQFGSVNWIMGMAQRPAAGGQVQLRSMFSIEPITVGRCGYPNLLQTGELCRGTPLHDRQHPHDVFMELGVDYRRGISDAVALELYGGPVGEPAIGPTAFPHRLSAMPNPVAPLSHHWLDASHISFGVVTAGVYGKRWKTEASVFNGREPDDERYDFDLGALDSYSGRVWLMPTPGWAIQVSAAHLNEAESPAAGVRANVDRVTASATYHRLVNSGVWATTAAWGRNSEDDHASSAFLIETAADVTTMDSVFARADITGKTAKDLVLPLEAHDAFTVGKLQIGYTRWLARGGGLKAGIGGSVGVSIVPGTLAPFYGGRVGRDFSVFLTVRPQ